MDPPASQVNLNIVKEAEIYKGPYQFRFGNSFGGTINFVSIDPKFTEKPVLVVDFLQDMKPMDMERAMSLLPVFLPENSI